MARNSAPAFQWYPADWIRKTRGLSPAAKGVWIDLISQMWWEDDQCSISGSADKLARICGCSVSDLIYAVNELKTEKICDVKGDFGEECNGVVTLVSRRMKKDRDNRKKTKKRVEKHRALQASNADSNGNVTRMFDVSSSSSSCTKVHSPHTPQGVEREDFLPQWIHLQEVLVRTGKCDGLTRELLAEAFRGVKVEPGDIPGLRLAAEGQAGSVGSLMPWLRKRARDLEKNKNGAAKDEEQRLSRETVDPEEQRARIRRNLERNRRKQA